MTEQKHELDDLWNESEGAPEFEPITPGDYHAKITSAKFEEGKDGKPDRVQWEYTITDEGCGFTNRKVWENNQITEQGVPFLVSNLAKLGIDKPKKISLIPSVLEQALEKRVAIKVTNKAKTDGSGGVWVNAYVQEVIDGKDPNFTEDDVPF